jgi:hypothetical protein
MKAVLNFFKNRSILFYIFWSSFWIGPILHLTILRECSGTLFRRDHVVARYASQIIDCNPITRPFFVDIFEYIFLATVVAYFFWYVFKFFRFIYRLGFQR